MSNILVRINWPIVTLILGMFSIISGIWLTLVLTHHITVDSGISLLSHLLTLLAGGLVPMAGYSKKSSENSLSFQINSNPPKEN